MTHKDAKHLLSRAFKHEAVTLTDQQVDELIALGDHGICFDAYLVCTYSVEAADKLKRAAYRLLREAKAA